MAASNTGGWVRRVGESGGGRTYRRRRPINFYGVLVLVVVLGIGSVAWARYEYLHPAGATTPTSAQPAVGVNPPWFAALGVVGCGHQLPALTANPAAAPSGLQAIKGGAIKIEPTKASQAGKNATLDKFVAAYRGLTVSTSQLSVPTSKGRHDAATTFAAGSVCPKGTPDAGKKGEIVIAVWKNVEATTPTLYSSPSAVRFSSNNMLITIAFVPQGTTPPKPPSTAIAAMFNGPTTSPTPTTTTTIATTPSSTSTTSTTSTSTSTSTSTTTTTT